MNITSISERTFFRPQQFILLPAIQRVWKEQQGWLVATLQSEARDLVLRGDGRAKYGTYSMMVLQTNIVLDVQLVQASV